MRSAFRYVPRQTANSSDWLVSLIFLSTGFLILFLVPWVIRSGPDRDMQVLVIQILGGSLTVLGAAVLLWILGGMYFQVYFPEYTEAWYFWGKLTAAAVAAAVFCIPTTLAFPFLLLAYEVRPNLIFAADVNPLSFLLVGFLISAIGVACLWLTFAVLSYNYVERRRWPRP